MTVTDATWGEPFSMRARRGETRRMMFQRVGGLLTVRELLEHIESVAADDVPAGDVLLSIEGTIRWERDPTDGELAEEAERAAHHERRKRNGELRLLRELTDRYGTDPEGWPAVDDDR